MARVVRLTGLVLGLMLAPIGGVWADTGVRVDRSVLDALGPAPRPSAGPGVEASTTREPPRATRRAAPTRQAGPEETTKDGVVRVPPPPAVTALPPREEGAPRPLAPSAVPPAVTATATAPTPPTAASARPSPPPAAPEATAQPPTPATPAPAPAAAAAPPAARPAPAPAPAPAPPPAAPAAASPAAASPAPTPAPIAVATAAPRAGAQLLRLGFTGSDTELDPASRQRVLGFAASVPDDESVRITVNAYAGGDPADPSRARRTSLSRALAVRTALMEGGIRSTRIDVRALGLAAGDGPPDRVDIIAGSAR